jgi:hypothetical protein
VIADDVKEYFESFELQFEKLEEAAVVHVANVPKET